MVYDYVNIHIISCKGENKAMELTKKVNRHSVYSLKYHLVLTTKYRRKCINKELYTFLEEETRRLFELWDVDLIEMNHDADHIHILMEAPPQVQLSKLINNYKTVTSRLMRKEFTNYLNQFYWKDNFWNRSYLILSSGGAPIEIIKQYIQDQGKEK